MQDKMSPPGLAPGRRRRSLSARASALLVTALAAIMLTVLGAGSASAATTPGTVTGSFTVPAGTFDPSDVSVSLIDLNGDSDYTAVDSDTGQTSASYTFSDVAPGVYHVYFYDDSNSSDGSYAGNDNVMPDYYGDGGTDTVQAATQITVTAGGSTTLNTVGLQNGATFTGTVTDPNYTGETGAYVEVRRVISGADPDPQLYDNWYQSVPAASSTYTISGLPAGTYRISYEAYGQVTYLGNAYVGSSGLTYDASSATTYPVSGTATTAVNIAVPVLGTISGTASGPLGPLPDEYVQIIDGLNNTVNSDTTAADGTYSDTVLPGTYKVEFAGLPDANLAQAWYGGTTEAQAGTVTVTPGGTTANINATLAAGGSISGTVVSGQGGTPLGGIDVELLDAQGNYITDVYTLPNGTYTIPDVPAGTWYLHFDAGQADNGTYYDGEFYGGTPREFGATGVAVTAGQAVTGVNGVLLPETTSALGLPTESGAALSGLHDNKVALKFNVAAGTDAGYLQSLTVKLPKGFSWNAKKLAADLSLGSGVTFTDTISAGSLVVTLTNGAPTVAFSVKAGGITVTKAIEKAAGGTTKKKTKKKKHALAAAAKAKKKKKKTKDTIKSEAISLSVSDTTGAITSLPITINHPH